MESPLATQANEWNAVPRLVNPFHNAAMNPIPIRQHHFLIMATKKKRGIRKKKKETNKAITWPAPGSCSMEVVKLPAYPRVAERVVGGWVKKGGRKVGVCRARSVVSGQRTLEALYTCSNWTHHRYSCVAREGGSNELGGGR